MADCEYQYSRNGGDLSQQCWYWGQLDKEEANRLLQDKDHGHFLVRDSAQQGEYTLVVRRRDKVRNIRILRSAHGLYGLAADACRFQAVSDLIQHYQTNPDLLRQRFSMIDLLYPVHRTEWETQSEDSTYDLLKLVVLKNKEMIAMNNTYSDHIDQRKAVQMELQHAEGTVNSMTVVLSLFEDQLCVQNAELSSSLMKPGARSEQHSVLLADNRALVQGRVDTLRSRLREIERSREDLETSGQWYLDEIHRIKPLLSHLKQEIRLLRLRLEDRGLVKDYLDLLLQDDSDIDLSHFSPRNWKVHTDRQGADRLLADRVPGTFLVRPTRDGGTALSIVCAIDDRVEARHCLIRQDPDTLQYGFHPEYCIFSTLEELVMKHQTITLQFYNPYLDVCLTYPVNYSKDSPHPHSSHSYPSQPQQ